MIFIKIDPITGSRKIDNGIDGYCHGNEMVDQWIAILMGWALGIYEKS